MANHPETTSTEWAGTDWSEDEAQQQAINAPTVSSTTSSDNISPPPLDAMDVDTTNEGPNATMAPPLNESIAASPLIPVPPVSTPNNIPNVNPNTATVTSQNASQTGTKTTSAPPIAGGPSAPLATAAPTPEPSPAAPPQHVTTPMEQAAMSAAQRIVLRAFHDDPEQAMRTPQRIATATVEAITNVTTTLNAVHYGETTAASVEELTLALNRLVDNALSGIASHMPEKQCLCFQLNDANFRSEQSMEARARRLLLFNTNTPTMDFVITPMNIPSLSVNDNRQLNLARRQANNTILDAAMQVLANIDLSFGMDKLATTSSPPSTTTPTCHTGNNSDNETVVIPRPPSATETQRRRSSNMGHIQLQLPIDQPCSSASTTQRMDTSADTVTPPAGYIAIKVPKAVTQRLREHAAHNQAAKRPRSPSATPSRSINTDNRGRNRNTRSPSPRMSTQQRRQSRRSSSPRRRRPHSPHHHSNHRRCNRQRSPSPCSSRSRRDPQQPAHRADCAHQWLSLRRSASNDRNQRHRRPEYSRDMDMERRVRHNQQRMMNHQRDVDMANELNQSPLSPTNTNASNNTRSVSWSLRSPTALWAPNTPVSTKSTPASGTPASEQPRRTSPEERAARTARYNAAKQRAMLQEIRSEYDDLYRVVLNGVNTVLCTLESLPAHSTPPPLPTVTNNRLRMLRDGSHRDWQPNNESHLPSTPWIRYRRPMSNTTTDPASQDVLEFVDHSRNNEQWQSLSPVQVIWLVDDAMTILDATDVTFVDSVAQLLRAARLMARVPPTHYTVPHVRRLLNITQTGDSMARSTYANWTFGTATTSIELLNVINQTIKEIAAHLIHEGNLAIDKQRELMRIINRS